MGELDSALTTYSAFEGYEAADLAGTVHDVREEIRKLPQLHDQLWDLFKPVRNKRDMEQFEQHLADEALRHEFYARLKAFSRCLHISLLSDKLFDVFDEAKVDALKRDWKQFSELKRSVQLRYQETVDVREFEPKIQKLLDDHVVAMPAETIIEVVNINDPDALKAVVEETGVSEASRADRIASATRRAITEKMDEDPTFYKQFSELLEEPRTASTRIGLEFAGRPIVTDTPIIAAWLRVHSDGAVQVSSRPRPAVRLIAERCGAVHQTGHSSIVQHFPKVKVGRAGRSGRSKRLPFDLFNAYTATKHLTLRARSNYRE